MSTPVSLDVSPWDQIISHVIDKLTEGIVNTTLTWYNHQSPDEEYFESGPSGWIYPVDSEFAQGDVEQGFNSEFEFAIEVFLPEAAGDQTRSRAIRTIGWNILQLIAHIISKRPQDFPGTWESIRARKISFPTGKTGQRMYEQVIITCLAKFRVVIPRA